MEDSANQISDVDLGGSSEEDVGYPLVSGDGTFVEEENMYKLYSHVRYDTVVCKDTTLETEKAQPFTSKGHSWKFFDTDPLSKELSCAAIPKAKKSF